MQAPTNNEEIRGPMGGISAHPSSPTLPHPAMQIMWHEGDDTLRIKLYHNNRIDVDAKHQMMLVLRVTLLSKEVQRKSTVRVKDAVLHRRSSYESGDCTLPPPPGVPFSPQGPQGNGFGGGFPGATGGYNIYKKRSSSSSVNEAPAATKPSRVNTTNNDNNNSPRKRKSPQNYNYVQRAGDENNDGDDVKMGEKLGINLVEDFFAAHEEELQKAADRKTGDY